MLRIGSDRIRICDRQDEEMQRTLRPSIAFAGLTAAGKTTHAMYYTLSAVQETRIYEMVFA